MKTAARNATTTTPRRPVRSALPSYISAALALLTCGGLMRPALATEPTVNTGLMQLAQANNTPMPSVDMTVAPTTPPPGQNPYALADSLKLRGWIVPLPGAADTVDQGLFGVRQKLAEMGLSYMYISADTFYDNILRHALPAGNVFTKHSRDSQTYNGQLPTYSDQQQLYVMYDLQKYGIPDGQLQFGATLFGNNSATAGADGFLLLLATYYQTFFNKMVEFKIGEQLGSTEFLGTQVGGSLANGVFGPNASISNENGLNSSGTPTWGVNVKLNLPNNFYDKVGVERAASPDGQTGERLGNPTGTNFKVTNAGALFIDEVGYRINPSPGVMQMWIRGAGSFTTSRYRELYNTAHREEGNFGLYLLADRQLLQTAPLAGPGSARRGIYAGATIQHAPSYFNTFSTYYEGRVYGFGLIPGRPNDLISFVGNHNQFSGYAIAAAHARGALTHDGASTFTASYGIAAAPGINLNLGLSFTDHPTTVTYTGSTGSSLNVLLNTVIFL